MIHNEPLIKKYSKKKLNDELVSFYTQWKNRYLKAVKNNADLEYLFYTLDQPMSNNAVTCSEAMGYGMVIFTIMSKFDSSAKEHFHHIYNFIKTYPSIYNNNLMAWQQIEDENGNIINSSAETSSATDGDMDISYGLLIANKLWKNDNTINYKDEALLRINALMESCVDKRYYFLTLGDWVKEVGNDQFKNTTRSSDFMIYIIREFIKVDKLNKNNWKKVIKNIRTITNNQLNRESKRNGLMPDFFILDNNIFIAPKTKILESIHDGDYFFNSCRTPWRYSMDTLINNGHVPKQMNILNKWIKNTTNLNSKNIKSGYYLANGTPGEAFGDSNNLAFIAPFLVSSLIEKGNELWKISLWNTLLEKTIDECTFYENTLKLISMIISSGNWVTLN